MFVSRGRLRVKRCGCRAVAPGTPKRDEGGLAKAAFFTRAKKRLHREIDHASRPRYRVLGLRSKFRSSRMSPLQSKRIHMGRGACPAKV